MNYEAFLETMLRLKTNTLEGEMLDRGLAIANTKALEDFWRYHIETGMREKLKMIWLTGFREDNGAASQSRQS